MTRCACARPSRSVCGPPASAMRRTARSGRLSRPARRRSLRKQGSRASARKPGNDARWRSAWRKACPSSWLGEAEADPPLNAVRQTLKALDELRAALKDCAELDHRIGAMERDKGLFAAEVAEIGEALGIEGRDGDAARLAETIEARVARARDDERRRQEKIRALEAARESLAKIVKALAVNAKLASAMTEFFGGGALSEVAVKLDE